MDPVTIVIRYINDVKNAPKERGKLAREVTSLLPLFTDLRYRIDESNATDPWFHGLRSLDGKGSPLEDFQNAMEEITTKLRPKKNVRKLAQIFAWTLEKKDVEGLLARIERLKSLVGLALQKDNFRLAQAIKDDISTNFENLEIERDTTRVKLWLAAPDPSSNHNAARKKWQPSTGEWFTHSKDFLHWKTASNSFLWVNGIPGSGKTVLCSTIIQSITELSQLEPSTIVAYFYFDFNDPNKQRTESLLRSLLTQFLAQPPSLPQCLQNAYVQSQNGQRQPTIDTMIVLLRQLLKGYGQTYLIIDALDECRHREELHELITSITRWNCSNIRMLATSRKEKDIEDSLQPFVSCQICIQSTLVNADIQVFVSEKLASDPKLRKWPAEAKREIEVTLIAGANGMFRWVVCQLDSLRKCLRLDALRKALATLPKTLDKTYERILSEVDDAYADDALKIFQWLCYSGQPMTLMEMVDVLATNFSDMPQFSPDHRLPDPRDILTICSSLVTITEEKDQWNRQQKYLRLAHFSVKEFLISNRVKDASIQSFAGDERFARVTIAKTCLAYLSYFDSFDILGEEDPTSFPLYRYAAENWTNHFMVSTDDKSRAHLDSLALRFLESNTDCFYNWIRTVTSRPYISELREGSRPHPLYYLSLLGYSNLASLLLENGANLVVDGTRYHYKHGQLPKTAESNENTGSQLQIYDKAGLNALGGYYGNALQAALHRGHMSTIELLLDHGAEIDLAAPNASNAWKDAIIQANQPALEFLLARICNSQVREDLLSLAMEGCSYSGNAKRIRLLLAHGANVNGRGSSGFPLHSACHSPSGNWEAVHILLQNGADVNAQIRDGNYALQTAARRGQVSIVQLLLDWDADINAQGGFFGNALQAASFKGNPELVRLLIKCGAEVNAQGGEYGSALQAAAYRGKAKVVRLLIKRGADVNAKGGQHGSALQAACGTRVIQVVRILLDHGADVNAESKDISCALWIASHYGKKQLVEMLLDAGADPNRLGKDGSLVLQTAMLRGHKKVALLLLQRGANADASGREQGVVREWNHEEQKYERIPYSSWRTLGLEELRKQAQESLGSKQTESDHET